MRSAARTDANHRAIVQALRGIGASVRSLATLGKDAPDLLVGCAGRNYLLEVKNPARGRRAAEQHDDWHAAWAGEVATVWTVEEALRAVGVNAASTT